ncbi:hypothetical protein SAMN05216199_2478 [Pedococcus cremeus]|uniref:Uncharacterized protein n=1 Tax=Pedococcus cremeus TaxID=587636 RepID=A0A1H9VPB5_9MICO|nr:hypothetical protein [Pedococcus cremeus]SES23525.1 hypothetical protein SAMN05216199_2478 [Pedococcus cremeus]
MSDTLTTQPALARTDAARPQPTVGDRTVDPRTIRRMGLTLTAGTLLWSASQFVYGPTAEGVGARVGDLTGLCFQVGVFALLTAMLRTGATGVTRKARAMIRVEYVLLGLASLWSLLHGVLPSSIGDGPVMMLDAFWPLSMLGMFVIGIKVAVAGRWQGVLRFWPLVAETWAVVTVPSFLLLGDGPARWIGATHLLIGYAALGLLLARRPELTGAGR